VAKSAGLEKREEQSLMFLMKPILMLQSHAPMEPHAAVANIEGRNNYMASTKHLSGERSSCRSASISEKMYV